MLVMICDHCQDKIGVTEPRVERQVLKADEGELVEHFHRECWKDMTVPDGQRGAGPELEGEYEGQIWKDDVQLN